MGLFSCCSRNKQTYRVGSHFERTSKGPVVVDLKRQNGSLDFTIGGGVEEDQLIFVSAPDKQKRLKAGDIILAVNGVCTAGCTLAEVVALIGGCGDHVKLDVLPTTFGHASSLEYYLRRTNRHKKVVRALYSQIQKSILEGIAKHNMSCTTRERPANEADLGQYIYVSPEEFDELKSRNAFLELHMEEGNKTGILRYKEALAMTSSSSFDLSTRSTERRRQVHFRDGATSPLKDQASSAAAGTEEQTISDEPLSGGGQADTAMVDKGEQHGVSLVKASSTELLTDALMQTIDAPVLRPENGEFGFIVSGGHPRNIRIHSIHPKSVAKNILKVNDVVTHIGGHELRGMSHAEVVELIFSLPVGRETLFTVLREKKKPSGPWEDDTGAVTLEPKRYVLLERVDSKGFGFTLAYDEDQNYNCVGDIAASGLAVRSGNLELGDCIAEVNGVDTRDMSHAELVQLIRNSPSVMRLMIERPVKNYEVTRKIETRQMHIRLVDTSSHFHEKLKTAEKQLQQTEEELKAHITAWTHLRKQHDAMLLEPQGEAELARLRETEEEMRELEARVVQEGVRAELLEEEFNAISLHLAHLGILSTEISLSGVKVVAHEELQNLKEHATILKEIQEERKALVQQLQAQHTNDGARGGNTMMMTVDLEKEPQGTFGFTIVGGGPHDPPFIDKLLPEHAAARAGLQRGDIITSINGHDVDDRGHDHVVGMIIRSGDTVTLTVVRQEANPEAAPKFNPPPLYNPRLDFPLTDLCGIANECLDVSIQIQLERRLVADVQQALQTSGYVPDEEARAAAERAAFESAPAAGEPLETMHSEPLHSEPLQPTESGFLGAEQEKRLLAEMEKRGLFP